MKAPETEELNHERSPDWLERNRRPTHSLPRLPVVPKCNFPAVAAITLFFPSDVHFFVSTFNAEYGYEAPHLSAFSNCALFWPAATGPHGAYHLWRQRAYWTCT